MKADGIGLYLHIPFCIRKCTYCDFCSYPVDSSDWREDYIKALLREIEGYKGQGIKVDTIFIGGGTPSLLSRYELERIVSKIREIFKVSLDCEFTIEANPGTVDADKLLALKSLGVNRLSFGLQSIHENELKKLGRIHTFEDFLYVYNLARECGFSNVNVDLMYGIPDQTASSFQKTLDTVASLEPEHLSVYGLILEEGTPLFESKTSLMLPSEDDECDMYYAAVSALGKSGYSHYEISNYSKNGFECKHNLKYWRNMEYIGIGVSAHSYFGSKRFSNPNNVIEYLSHDSKRTVTSEVCDSTFEYTMLHLRLSEGINLEDYRVQFNEDFVESRSDIIKALCKSGYARISNGRFFLTESGFYVSNAIIAQLL